MNMKWPLAASVGLFVIIIFNSFGGSNSNAFSFLGFGNMASWKEEVQLHDGSKIF